MTLHELPKIFWISKVELPTCYSHFLLSYAYGCLFVFCFVLPCRNHKVLAVLVRVGKVAITNRYLIARFAELFHHPKQKLPIKQ